MIDETTNVLYATVDSLRKDAVNPDAMPYVSQLADEGISFEQMTSTAPATAASFVGLQASRYFSDVDGVGLPDEEFTTLAEAMPDDYAAVGHSTNQFTSSYYNYGRGFDEFSSPTDGIKFTVRRYLDEEDALFKVLETGYNLFLEVASAAGSDRADFTTGARRVNETLRAAVGRYDGPRFLWGHYMDPHHPYEPPEEYLPASVESRAHGQRLSRELPGKVPAERADDLARCRQLYHAECRSFDDAFADLHADLPEDTLVVIVGDHGELLGEHDRLGHPHEMWETLINVPCIFYHPDLPSATIESQQTTLDLAPTILDLVGGDVPHSMRGRPIDLPAPTPREQVFGTIETPDKVAFAREAGRKWMLHKSRRSTQTDHGDLLVDPHAESVGTGTEAAEEQPDVVKTLRSAFRDEIESGGLARGRRWEDEEVKRHMADLGYLQQQ